MIKSVGWIGTGEMGAPMCERLLTGGLDVGVWNRTRTKTETLQAIGATIVEKPSDLAVREVVFIILTDAAAISEVLTGPAGLLTAPTRPAIVVNCSTVTQQQAAHLRDLVTTAGSTLITAPIAAAASMIASGGAAMVASGPSPALARVMDLLTLIAPTVTVAGTKDEALLVKIGSEALMAAFTCALFEISRTLEAVGVEASALHEFVNGSAIGSPYSKFKGDQYLHGQTSLSPALRVFRRRSLDEFHEMAQTADTLIPVSDAVRGLS